MSKFKAGDKVRYVKDNGLDIDMTIGNEYIVSEYKGEDLRPLFVIDDEGEPQGFHTGQFELVEDECSVSDGDIIEKDGKEYKVQLRTALFQVVEGFEKENPIQIAIDENDEMVGLELRLKHRVAIEPYVENEVIKFRWKK